MQIKGESPAGTTCWYSAHAAVGGNLVESSEMMEEYVAKATLRCIMVSQLCTLDFTEFLQNCYQAKIQIKFYGFLHHRPIFYVVRLYVMTKMNGRCLKGRPLALFAVMSQNFI